MGEATVISHKGDGLYSAKIEYDGRSVETAIAAMDAEIAEIEVELESIEEDIEEAQDAINDKKPEVNDLIEAYNQAVYDAINVKGQEEQMNFPDASGTGFSQDVSFSWDVQFSYDVSFDLTGMKDLEYLKSSLKSSWNPANGEVKQAYHDLLIALAEIHALMDKKISFEKLRDMRKIRQNALEKKKAEMEQATDPNDIRDIWCTDLSKALTDTVETMEINGAPNTIIIGPGGDVNIRDDQDSPGKLANVMAMSPAQMGLAWALLPGWQKFRPTYRVGSITSIDYEEDTATVQLDQALSVAQNLPINEDENGQAITTLSNIPVEYMHCNSKAFETSDRVVVEMPGQEWGTGPRVIGFETNPQACPSYVALIGGTEDMPGYDDDDILEIANGATCNYSGGYSRSVLPDDVNNYNNLWKVGNIVRMGCNFEYPYPPAENKGYYMLLHIELKIYGAGGSTLMTMPLQVPYGEGVTNPWYYSTYDKTMGPYMTDNFAGTYRASYGSPEYALEQRQYDYNCPLELYGQIIGALYNDYGRFRFNNLNTVSPSYLWYYTRHWTWIDELYQESMGIPEPPVYTTGNMAHLPTCSEPWVDAITPAEAGITDYSNLTDFPDPLSPDKLEKLYLNHSWSMQGTIQEDGIYLIDGGTARIDNADITLPFGPFSNENATSGAKTLTYGFVSPSSMEVVPHHVGFNIRTNNVEGTHGIITELDYVGGEWSSQYVCNNKGMARFYAVVETEPQ